MDTTEIHIVNNVNTKIILIINVSIEKIAMDSASITMQ